MPPAAAKFAVALLYAAAILTGAAAAAQAAKLSRRYQYYTISAATINELEAALNRRGPIIKETGRRHAAASLISFKPYIKLGQGKRYCFVEQADISIYATVTLPQWKQRKTAKQSAVTAYWDILARDMKQHEEQHLLIAQNHGAEMEQELRALPTRRSCRRLQADAADTLARLMEKNNAAQIQFDAAEGKNFQQRLSRKLRQAEKPAARQPPRLRAHP